MTSRAHLMLVLLGALLLLPHAPTPAAADVIATKKKPKTKKKRAKKRARPPRRPWSKDRLCRRNRDCVLMPSWPCDCPPCGDVWREAVNRKALKRFKMSWARKRCKKPKCRKCEGRYLGTRALCIKKQCTVR